MLSSSLAFAALAVGACGSSGGSTGSGGSGGSTGAGATGGAHAGSGGGSGGGGSGGMADTGGTYACMHTMTGTHMHPFTIPSADVDRGADKTYVLADGGTGHTTCSRSRAYDFAYLKAGTTQPIDSTTTQGHLHTVSITCTAG